MGYKGLNKKLYDRRIELDFSTREASIKLDISRLYLYLIERGYLPVFKKYQQKFIHKYELEEDFFNKEELKYPTPIENKEKEHKSNSKFSKIFTSWIFKLLISVFVVGFATLAVLGVTFSKEDVKSAKSFFSNNVLETRAYAIEHPDDVLTLDPSSDLSIILVDSFYRVANYKTGTSEYEDTSREYDVDINFFSLDEHISYTFWSGWKLDPIEVYSITEGNIECEIGYEIRAYGNYYREHMFLRDADGSEKLRVNLSVDYDGKNFIYNAGYYYDDYFGRVKFENTSLEYLYYQQINEGYIESFISECNNFFASAHLNNGAVSYDNFANDQLSGVVATDSALKRNTSFIICGMVFGIICLASLIASLFYSFKSSKKFIEIADSNEDSIANIELADNNNSSNKKPLKKDWFIFPIIPEFVIKIAAICVLFITSITLFKIFEYALSGDIVGIIDKLGIESAISSFFSMSLLIVFFTKLDTFRNNKNQFIINYILFFAGLLYYLLLILIRSMLNFSETFMSNIGYIFIEFMPGNIIWGALAFNLLITFLFTSPKSIIKDKKKAILYRLLVILPLSYLIISLLYTIGAKCWGWIWPFEVSSIFMSKSYFLIAFAIFYAFGIFIYRKLLVHKYGAENALVYENGNCSAFMRNVITALIITLLVVLDFILSKCLPDSRMHFGSNIVLIYLVPIILLYRSHLGKRSKVWDLGFAMLYGFALVIGIVLIAFQILGYVAII